MSNIIVGDIFLKIIEEVASASQTDFEENGVNQQTLLELQQTWQSKLSSRNVAQMPWDPKPAPPPPANLATPSSQNGTPMGSYAPQNQMQADGQPQIKREPGAEGAYNGGQNPSQGYAQAMNPALAQQRAASLLQQQFGSQANASLGAMQQRGIALPGQQKPQPQGNLQLPGQNGQNGQNQQAMQQQYAQQMKQQTASQQTRIKTEDGQSDHKPYQQNGLSYAQTDGSGDAMDDWRALLAATRALSSEQIANNDRLMRDHVAESSRALENGLMLPLSQQKSTPKTRKTHARRAAPRVVQGGADGLYTIPQLDGEFDDDEDDENAINSDLDDDDDDAANAEEDDEDIDSMLCTYDKVQRVKNKWKCTLKDGVLSANGREYLFHKAQGEFEW